MPFELTPNIHVRRDEEGHVRQLRHPQEPFEPPPTAPTPQVLARAYLSEAAEVLEYTPELLSTLGQGMGDAEPLSDEESRLRFAGEKAVGASRVVFYEQTHLGLPVWRAGASVAMEAAPLRVISATNEVRYDVDVEPPGADAKYTPSDETNIRRLLTRLLGQGEQRVAAINGLRYVIYRYDPDKRFDFDERMPERQVAAEEAGAGPSLVASMRAIETPAGVEAGRWYVATEVLFTLPFGPWPVLHWRALLEAAAGSVLYLQPGVTGVDGLVFLYDPQSQSGDATVNPCSDAATVLNAWRQSVALQGLTAPPAGAEQELDGQYVTLGEQAAPVIAPPTRPAGSDFDFGADTDDFAAVNAYYHVDEALRFVDALPGLSIASYFDNSAFPVTVDHRDASLGTVNARAYANAAFNGSGGFGFNLAQTGCPVGIAADIRVVWHEICHALLLENVSTFNFGFAHSAGDALGVILSDPAAPSIDRFETFPFNTINRRHDRDVTAGWAWGGANDVGSYSSEQILATTLFRLYRSIGGDSGSINQRRLAARHTAFLVIGAIGTLTPATNPGSPDGFATALMDFDKGNDFDGISRGGLHKVVRWAFERQGLYQPPGAPVPVTSAGAPPDVDVYIDDGRPGTYDFLGNFWSSTDIWNRLAPDGGAAHQTPVTDQPNYMYVRVRNRGTQNASGVSVAGYHCVPGTGLVWPDDWQAMAPASLAGADVPPGGLTVVGPFEWTPTVVGHECLLAIAQATGDPANDATVTGAIPHSRFVPFDNNVGQRNVAPVAGGGGAVALAASFADRRFLFSNPLDRTIRATLDVEMPAFLAERGWKLGFANAGGGRFTLGPRAAREVVLRLEPGEAFRAADVPGDLAARAITVLSKADGVVVGGMTYEVDPRLEKPPAERPPRGPEAACIPPAIDLLDCLGLPDQPVAKARIRRITVDIDLEDPC